MSGGENVLNPADLTLVYITAENILVSKRIKTLILKMSVIDDIYLLKCTNTDTS